MIQFQLSCLRPLDGAILAAYEKEIPSQIVTAGLEGKIQLAECVLHNAILV